MGYKFGKRSLKKIEACHKDLQKIMKLAISRSRIDFGISEGHRSLSRQYQLYLEGKTKIDGRSKRSKHNYSPSLAADIYVYHPNLYTRQKLVYDTKHLSYVAGVIISCTKELIEKGEIYHDIRWGANWNKNGIIDYDQSFDDYPHFELVNL